MADKPKFKPLRCVWKILLNAGFAFMWWQVIHAKCQAWVEWSMFWVYVGMSVLGASLLLGMIMILLVMVKEAKEAKGVA